MGDKSKENAPGAGFEFPSYEVAWLKRDLLLFANSIGCTVDELHFLYELHSSFAAFPTYPILLPFKHTDVDVIDFYARSSASRSSIPGVPAFDPRRSVDGERRMRFLRPIPTSSAGRRFEIRSKVLGVYDKGKAGSVIETQADLVDAESGEVYTSMIGSGFAVGQGNWGGPKGPKAASYPPPSNKRPDATHTLRTSAETPLLYRLNGDYNPLHADPAPGRAMGFGGTIIHGLWTWNACARALLAAFGASDPSNLREFYARFTSPVRPGDVLVLEMWRMGSAGGEDGFEEVRFTARLDGQGGKTVLSNGRAVVKVVGAGKSKL